MNKFKKRVYENDQSQRMIGLFTKPVVLNAKQMNEFVEALEKTTPVSETIKDAPKSRDITKEELDTLFKTFK